MEVISMTVFKASHARARMYRLIDEVASLHRPVLITGKRNNAVLVSEEDWSSIQETLYLVSIPGMRKSIVEGLKTPLSKCVRDLQW
jgi:prevent-host-death family protein